MAFSYILFGLFCFVVSVLCVAIKRFEPENNILWMLTWTCLLAGLLFISHGVAMIAGVVPN